MKATMHTNPDGSIVAVFIGADVKIGKRVTIGIDVKIGDRVWIGDDVTIESGVGIGRSSTVVDGTYLTKGKQFDRSSNIS